MALTPTVLIATSGLTQGQGLGVNTEMNNVISSATTNPLVTSMSAVSGYANVTAITSSLPSFITGLPSQAANIAIQANAIVPTIPGNSDPAAGIKSFISLQGASAGGAGILAEFSAALTDFGSKSFGDLGINNSNFHDILTQGVTSMTPSLGRVAGLATQLPLGSLGPLSGTLSGLGVVVPSQGLSGINSLASTLGGLIPSGVSATNNTFGGSLPNLASGLRSAAPSIAAGQGQTMGGLSSLFGTMSSNLNPTALAKGQAELTSSSLNEGLASIGTGLQNFGSLYDFTDLQTLGPQNMLTSLQAQGLAASTGINDWIASLGFNPADSANIPDQVLKDVFSNITDNDLQKIIAQTGVVLSKQAQSLADLLDPSYIMPNSAVAALGLGNGSGAIKDLANTLTNLGVQGNNMQIGGFIASMKTQALNYLSQVTQLVPASVQATLKPLLGTGAGLFGNPTMSDMIGTAAGATHTDAFNNIASTLTALMNSSIGQNLNTALVNVKTAIASGTGVPAALSALTTQVSNFNSQVANNTELQADVTAAQTSYTASLTQIKTEISNLNIVGLNLSNAQLISTGVTGIMNLGNKLHNYGIDKQQLGHNELFSGIATDDLTGDAIQASLLEGRNLAKSYAIGKSTPGVANEGALIAGASAGSTTA